MTDTQQHQRTGTTNELARNARLYIDNAATASQNVSLLDDPVTREAIELNVIAPLIVAMSERDATIARLTADNKALTADKASMETALKIKADEVRDIKTFTKVHSAIVEAKLAKVEAELADERLHFSNYMAVVEPKIDSISAELAEARKLLEKSLHDFAPVSLQNHKRDVASFLASKEAGHAAE